MFNHKTYNLPRQPGCYAFKNKKDQIIYVGKAKNLKNRVSSYFLNKPMDDKTKLMVKRITDLEFIVTDNEVEALLLEAKLIKKHKPKYNIDLKHSERYAYIKITDEKFPRVITARQKTKDGIYYGPFTDGSQRKALQYLANRIFKLRTCKKLPKKVCLNYHIKMCYGPCENKISESEYLANIEKAKLLLKGQDRELIKQLTIEMKALAQQKQYEKAKAIRDQIFALQNLKEKQKVAVSKAFNQDIINFIQQEDKTYIQMFNINKGIVSNRQSFEIAPQENLDAFIKQYYFFNEIPQEVIVPRQLDDHDNIKKYLSKLRKTKVKITVPQKGLKKQLLALVMTNLKQNLTDEEKVLLDLQAWLNLPTVPTRIECFDISNLKDKYTVGAMVHFFNGQPDKNNYRRFKIKTVSGQDDYSMIAEVVGRRYYRLVKDNAPLPDLIIIDGGKGQLSAAVEQLKNLNLTIPIIGLAKKFEEVYQPGIDQPKRLTLDDPRLKLLRKIRDEAHRFAIKYHRLLREKL
jgi:excinuclease ABC subunit C